MSRALMDSIHSRQSTFEIRTVGSGLNWTLIVPSLDLVATLNGRTPNSMNDAVSAAFTQNLFAAVTQEYVTCDGQVVNAPPSQVPVTPSVAGLRLMNAIPTSRFSSSPME